MYFNIQSLFQGGYFTYNPRNIGKSNTREINKMVVFGASIMQLTFSGTGQQLASDEFYKNGLSVEVFERATSGDDTNDMLLKIDAIIAEFQEFAENTVFMIHWAGNDLRSYPNNATQIDTNCRLMAQKIKDAGFMIAMSNITYREVPPYPYESQPYNEGVMDAIVSDFADIPLDLYTLVFDNKDVWFGDKAAPEYDGVHPWGDVGTELNRVYIAGEISKKITNVIIPESQQFQDVLIQFGNNDVMVGGLNKAVNGSVDLYNTDYTRVESGTMSFSNVNLTSNTGRGNELDPTNDTISLFNNAGLSDFSYTEQDPMIVDFSNAGINLNSTYTVKITASRETADNGDRTGLYTIGESSKLLNAASSPPEIIEMTVSGLELQRKGLVVSLPVGSTFAYISMLQATKL